MGLFGNKEPFGEVVARVENSDCAKLFSNVFCSFFNEGGDFLDWMMAKSKERMCKLVISKSGVLIKRTEVSRIRYKQTGTYDVDTNGWGFGPSGYQDLPNSDYVTAFKEFLTREIKENCPYIKFVDYETIMIADNAKKSW